MNISITSAIKLDANQEKKVATVLQKKYANAKLHFVIDQECVGGIKITIGSKQVDFTIANQLNQLEKALVS